jgi:hypothetical protein
MVFGLFLKENQLIFSISFYKILLSFEVHKDLLNQDSDLLTSSNAFS